MSKLRFRHNLRNPFKPPDRKPDPKPAAVDPATLCPGCRQPAKRSSKILEGSVVLRCVLCKKVAVLGSLPSEWIEADHPLAIERLKDVAEQIRRHKEMWGSGDNDPRWVTTQLF